MLLLASLYKRVAGLLACYDKKKLPRKFWSSPMLDEIVAFLSRYPVVAALLAAVLIILAINLLKTAFQAAIAAGVIMLAYIVFLLLTGDPAPDVDQVLDDGQGVVDSIRDEGSRKLKEKLKEESGRMARDAIENGKR